VVTRDIRVLVPSRVRMTQPAKSTSSMNARATIGRRRTKADLKGAADSCSSVATTTGAVAVGGGEHVYSRGEMGRSRNCCQQDQNKVDDYPIRQVHNVQNSCLKPGEKEKG
jgi:hypothetical protein